MKKMLMVLLLMLLGGCGSYGWVKDDGNYSNLEKDEFDCELQRAEYEQGRIFDFGETIAGWNMMERCMKLKGYIWGSK